MRGAGAGSIQAGVRGLLGAAEVLGQPGPRGVVYPHARKGSRAEPVSKADSSARGD